MCEKSDCAALSQKMKAIRAAAVLDVMSSWHVTVHWSVPILFPTCMGPLREGSCSSQAPPASVIGTWLLK